MSECACGVSVSGYSAKLVYIFREGLGAEVHAVGMMSEHENA